MKHTIIILSIISLALWGCAGNSSKSDSEKSNTETIEIEKEIMKNDSISVELENKIKKIEAAEDSLEHLLNELN